MVKAHDGGIGILVQLGYLFVEEPAVSFIYRLDQPLRFGLPGEVQGGARGGIGLHCSDFAGKAHQFAAEFAVEQFALERVIELELALLRELTQ